MSIYTNCKQCEQRFIRKGVNHKFCGSHKNKTGCSYLRRKFKNNNWNKLHGTSQYTKFKVNLLKDYNNSCLFCNSEKNLSIDHIIPRMIGGNDNIENLRILCKSCNSKRHHNLIKNALKYYFNSGFTD